MTSRLCISIFLLLLIPATALSEEKEVKEQEVGCAGVFYKAKKDDVPVFDRADATGKVPHRLSIGEKVCYIGEEKDFVIITKDEGKALFFVRRTDLWAPKREKNRFGMIGVVDWIKEQYNYMRHGGVPEDGLLPYRPVLDIVGEKPKEEEIDGETEK